jgi:6-phosphogluconolactonase
MQKFELASFANADELARAAASAWLDEIEIADRANEKFCVALSGGRIAQKFYAQTVEQAKERKISFARVRFFWADERCVPPTDPESNFKIANELLFAPLKISENQIHRLRGEILPDDAVKIAEAELCKVTSDKNNFPKLDLIFLGMGEDGHIASLFPNASSEIINCVVPFLVIRNSPKPPPTRISFSFGTIFSATKVWVLVSGAGKENALRDSLNFPDKTPLGRVIQTRLNTKIFSDLQNFNL